ncbi:DUF1868 domain-containing protein [Agrobacterium larrymoorei]|uniref:DUF1868 domain-containing protein n=1 Tax=Agrobacterium larrymoorei TaxID=160699 RepID=UPI001571AFFD|nr:DUF1868 domain-containing protein [Agrobacterium larrymoorei]NTJ41021.1 DUF1868 domain-containing protein [Agrobacterium larrymoorei]
MHAPLVSSKLAKFSTVNNDAPPRHLGTRYSLAGEFLAEPGNTVVCHLIEGSRTQNAIVDVRQRLIDMPEAATHLAFTPISSLHMTVFQGIIEHRRTWPFWPKEMPEDTAVEDMTAYYRRRLENFPKLPSFDMQVTAVTPLGLTLGGATSEDDRIVAEWRNAFAEAFGYRHPDQDTYEFHITFAYVRRWFEPECLPNWQALLDDCLRELRTAAPVIELHPPAFCEFRDMKHFEELIVFEPL